MRKLLANELEVVNGGGQNHSVPADPMPSAPSQPPMVPPPWYQPGPIDPVPPSPI